jgi:hypothetical protein
MEVHRRSDSPDAQVDHFDKHRETHRKVDIAFGICIPRPSPTSATPIISNKDSARTFTVGLRLTKELMGPAENIITPTARISYASINLRLTPETASSIRFRPVTSSANQNAPYEPAGCPQRKNLPANPRRNAAFTIPTVFVGSQCFSLKSDAFPSSAGACQEKAGNANVQVPRARDSVVCTPAVANLYVAQVPIGIATPTGTLLTKIFSNSSCDRSTLM